MERRLSEFLMAAASTVRFTDLVKKGGRPEVHLSWVAPAKDAELQRALKQHRLVTLHQHARGPRDFGVVGFEPGRDAQFLVFPKSLRAFAGRKIVGIKYEMLEDASTEKPSSSGAREKPKNQSPRLSAARTARARADKPARRTEIKREPEPEADFITDTDPLKREVRKALIALSAGRTAEAKRRLQGILSAGSDA